MSLRKTMLAMALAGVATAITPAISRAQEQMVTEIPTAKYTAIGEANASGVNVRSGPAESYYPTIQLNKGDRVTVVGHKFDWLKILPPAGSFSYVAKIYVDRDAAGTSGKVNRDDVLVRAGSSLNQLKTEKQMKLGAGAVVQIIGEADEYYKITPPEGSCLYVSKKFVDLVGAATTEPSVSGAPMAAAAGGAAVKSTDTAGDTSAAVSTVEKQTKKAESVKTEPKTNDAASSDVEVEFRKLETQFAQAKDQPVESQPVSELLAGYQGIQDNPQFSSASRRTAALRVQYLTAVKQQQDELIQAKQADADFKAKQAALEEEQKQIEQRLKNASVAVYTAVGQLTTSSVMKDGQPMMRLVDPADSRTLIYVRMADAKQRGLVSKFVGVRGSVMPDATLGIDVIEPTEVEIVDPAKVFKGVTAKIYPPSAIPKSTEK